MIGYDVSWASFAIVEVMSQPKFAHKRIGCLAANQVRKLVIIYSLRDFTY
jgi:AP-3 complex subunit delta-1